MFLQNTHVSHKSKVGIINHINHLRGRSRSSRLLTKRSYINKY